MTQRYVVPNIYQDISDQSQGYFAFRFCCQECYWSVDTRPIRSTVSTISNVMDIGVGLLGGFWGRAAQAGEQMYGSKWHTEQALAPLAIHRLLCVPLAVAWGLPENSVRTVVTNCLSLTSSVPTAPPPLTQAHASAPNAVPNSKAQHN